MRVVVHKIHAALTPELACTFWIYIYIYIYYRPRPKDFEVYVPYLEFAPYVCRILAFDVWGKKYHFLQCGKKKTIFDRRLNVGEKGDPVQAELDLYFATSASRIGLRSSAKGMYLIVSFRKKNGCCFRLIYTTDAAEEEEEVQEQQQQEQHRVNFFIDLETIFTFLDIL